MFNYIQVKMDDRRDHVYIAWSFYSLILSDSGKYRLICSLIVKGEIVLIFYFQSAEILNDLIGVVK